MLKGNTKRTNSPGISYSRLGLNLPKGEFQRNYSLGCKLRVCYKSDKCLLKKKMNSTNMSDEGFNFDPKALGYDTLSIPFELNNRKN